LGPVAALIADKKLDEAEKRLREVLRLSGERAKDLGWVHARLGTVLAQQRRIDEAIEAFQAAVAANPRDGRTMTGLGLLLGARQRLDEAIEVFEKAIRLDPVFAITHINYGAVLRRAGRLDEAIEQYRTAIRKDPNQARAYVGLSQVLAAQGKLDEAIRVINQAIEITRPSGNDAFVRQLETLREQYRLKQGGAP
ncbi:MAG: tetratricopeptide repeat protein, partial [Planctomycetota bacterium]